jgi:hypothetical protein
MRLDQFFYCPPSWHIHSRCFLNVAYAFLARDASDLLQTNAGLGLSVHAPFRIATDTTSVSIPENTFGSLQQVGLNFFLSRLSSGIDFARYLLLTGRKLNGMEA